MHFMMHVQEKNPFVQFLQKKKKSKFAIFLIANCVWKKFFWFWKTFSISKLDPFGHSLWISFRQNPSTIFDFVFGSQNSRNVFCTHFNPSSGCPKTKIRMNNKNVYKSMVWQSMACRSVTYLMTIHIVTHVLEIHFANKWMALWLFLAVRRMATDLFHPSLLPVISAVQCDLSVCSFNFSPYHFGVCRTFKVLLLHYVVWLCFTTSCWRTFERILRSLVSACRFVGVSRGFTKTWVG